MMQATELRIGNYLQQSGSTLIFRARSIIAREKPAKEGYNIYDERGFIRLIEEIKPIPLTEQWLIDFGFKNGCMPINFWNGSISCELVLHESRKSFIATIEPIEAKIYHSIIIKHVHQLQNLYHALTNTELQLKK